MIGLTGIAGLTGLLGLAGQPLPVEPDAIRRPAVDWGAAAPVLVLIGSFLTKRWWAIVAATGVILAAVYLLWAYQRVFHGTPDDDNRHFPEISWKEGMVVAPILALIVFLGVYPKPVLERMQPSVDRLIEHVDENSDFTSPRVEPQEAGR